MTGGRGSWEAADLVRVLQKGARRLPDVANHIPTEGAGGVPVATLLAHQLAPELRAEGRSPLWTPTRFLALLVGENFPVLTGIPFSPAVRQKLHSGGAGGRGQGDRPP